MISFHSFLSRDRIYSFSYHKSCDYPKYLICCIWSIALSCWASMSSIHCMFIHVSWVRLCILETYTVFLFAGIHPTSVLGHCGHRLRLSLPAWLQHRSRQRTANGRSGEHTWPPSTHIWNCTHARSTGFTTWLIEDKSPVKFKSSIIHSNTILHSWNTYKWYVWFNQFTRPALSLCLE